MEYEKTFNFKAITVNKRNLDSITVTLPTALQFDQFTRTAKQKTDTEAMIELVAACSGETVLAIKSLWFFIVSEAFSFLTLKRGDSSEATTTPSDETNED